MNKSQKKFVVIVIVILIILIIVIFLKKHIDIKSNKFLILGDYLILEKNSKEWSQIEEVNEDILKQKYTVDTKDRQYVNVTISYDSNNWHYMDKDYKNIDTKEIRAAYTNLKDISLANFTKQYADESDISNLKMALSQDNINNIDSFLPATTKVIIDIDKDGEAEYIYTTTNASLAYTGEKEISKMFIVKNNKITTITDDTAHGPYSVMEILDIDNNGKYDVIVNKGNVNLKLLDSCYQIYEVDNEKWKLKQDCQV